jgi:MFS transporter, DHA1 family, tetracycline resistance protein
VLACANLVYGYFVLPESLPADQRRAVGWRAVNPFAAIWALVSTPGLGLLTAALAAAGLAQFTLYSSWVLYTTYRFGWGPGMNGWALFLVGIVAALGQGFLMARILKAVPPSRLALWALASTSLAYLGWGLATAAWVMFVVIAANVLGAMTMSTLQSMISAAAPADQQGRVMGAVSGLNSAMAVAGPLIGAPLMMQVSHLSASDLRMGLPMYACAAFAACALVLAALHVRRHVPLIPAPSST